MNKLSSLCRLSQLLAYSARTPIQHGTVLAPRAASSIDHDLCSKFSSLSVLGPNLPQSPPLISPGSLSNAVRSMASLMQLHRDGPHRKVRHKKRPLDGKPFMKGVVLKLLIKKPRKPNSANRKCVLVKLSNDKEMVAYIPGEGNNLQEHNIVLCKVGRVQDTPGVKLKVVRGKYDCAHVIKRSAPT